MRNRDIAKRAFSTPEWAAAADAIFKATGLVVSVVDFGACELLAGGQPCAYCYLATGISQAGPEACFDRCPEQSASSGRVTCRAGLPALYSAVTTRGDRTVAHVVVSGFVTSTRERRGRYEYLLSRGVSEDAARRSLKALPIIARAQAEAYLQMALASAHTVFEAMVERIAAAERIEELRLFVSAGQHVVSANVLDSETLGGIAEEAVAMAGGEAGAILRPHGDSLEVVAHTSAWRGAVGALVPLAATASGRAIETRRAVVSPGRPGGNATLAMPLIAADKALGVLEVRLPPSAVPLPPDQLSRLSRFGQFMAIALEREDERVAVQRAMTGYGQLSELASALGGQTDVDGVAQVVLSAIKRSFGFQVGGLVLTGWGRDRADVVVRGDITSEDVEHVLGDVCGRDVSAQPFDTLRLDTREGALAPVEPAMDWAISSVELSYGDLEVGWLFVARSDGQRYSAQDRALLEGVAAHGGPAMGRAALFSRVRDDYAATIAALSATLDAGEHGTSGHAGRVMDYSMLIGQEMGLGFEDVEQLRFAGLMHDVGKTGVPAEILLKPSKLTADELLKAHSHSEIGASIIDQISFLKSLTPIVLHHHERWDGAGYPHGIAGDAIPLLARVLSVADAFDAMTGASAYKPKLSIRQAREELAAGAGTQFDPTVVAALFSVLDRMVTAGATGLLAPRDSLGRPDLLA